MATKRDYYEILGISKNATQDEVKRAFRKLAMQYHPDRNKAPDAEAKFKEINEAYEVLNDSQKRSRYDQFGHAGTQQQSGFNGGGFEDMFSGFSGGNSGSFNFEDIFSGVFGGGGRQQQRTRKKELYETNIEATIRISFLDSVLGAKKKIKYKIKRICKSCGGSGAESDKHIKTCPQCGGRGYVVQQHRTMLGIMQSQVVCPNCNGNGKVISKACSYCHGKKYFEEEATVEFQIQPGIRNGERIMFSGKGNSTKTQTGNLYLTIQVEGSRIFKRSGDTLHVEVLVDPITAIVGGDIYVPTPTGLIKHRLNANTPNGSEITVNGVGIKNIKHKMFSGMADGDIVAKIVYAKPSKYSKAELELLRRVADVKNEEVEKYKEFLKKELN